MAILKMKKFHLLVLNSKREKLLRELQIFRNIQFEDSCKTQDFKDEKIEKFKKIDIEQELIKYDETLNKVSSVIDFVTKYSSPISGIKDVMKGLPNYTFEELEEKIKEIDYEEEFKIIKSLKDELEVVEDELNKKKELIEELKPLSSLDIKFNEMKKLKKFTSLVGEVSWKLVEDFKIAMSKLENTYCEQINVFNKEYYFFIISDNKEAEKLEEVLKVGNFNKIKLDIEREPKEELKLLNEEIVKLYKRRSEIILEAGSKNNILEDFKLEYEYVGNLKVRLLAKQEFMNTSNVSSISGYCPEFEVERLKDTIEKNCSESYTLEFEEVDRNSEDVPIMLKNNKFIRVFESITSIYAMPKYNEIDPTPLYAPLYAIFFGMMAADFGYGAILVILTALGLKLCNFTPSMRKNVKFFQLLGITTAIWGFLYGSYFGGKIAGMWQLLDLGTQFMTVLVVSVIMGGLHLFYALAIKAYMEYRDKQYANIFFDVVSWYISLIAIIVLLLSIVGVIPEAYKAPAKTVTLIGIVLLIIAGARQTKGNIAQKLVAGLYNVYGISNYIGD
ncbi:MAG: hypothetical protein KGV57_03165, partial [Fusobacterium sp.]|nr:hypothetical protein [Fusobacterium sp.]